MASKRNQASSQEKAKLRVIRNREAAQQSRERQKRLVANLKDENQFLKIQNQDLNTRVQELERNYNKLLKLVSTIDTKKTVVESSSEAIQFPPSLPESFTNASCFNLNCTQTPLFTTNPQEFWTCFGFPQNEPTLESSLPATLPPFSPIGKTQELNSDPAVVTSQQQMSSSVSSITLHLLHQAPTKLLASCSQTGTFSECEFGRNVGFDFQSRFPISFSFLSK